jgi:hypothetical protein
VGLCIGQRQYPRPYSAIYYVYCGIPSFINIIYAFYVNPVIHILFPHIADHVFSGDVYVLTGADSFSAAMGFATLLSDNGLGMVVGEIPVGAHNPAAIVF